MHKENGQQASLSRSVPLSKNRSAHGGKGARSPPAIKKKDKKRIGSSSNTVSQSGNGNMIDIRAKSVDEGSKLISSNMASGKKRKKPSQYGPSAEEMPNNILKYVISTNEELGLTVADSGYDANIVWVKYKYWTVTEVKQGSQAEKLGIQRSSRMYKVGNELITTAKQFKDVFLQEKVKNEKLELLFFRPTPLADIWKSTNTEYDEAPQIEEAFSLIPSSKGVEVSDMQSIRTQCNARVKLICDQQYLIPQSGSLKIADACTYVYTCLKSEMPVGLESKDMQESQENCTWLHGNKSSLCGPQIWMLTRDFIVARLFELLEDEGWISAPDRKKALDAKQREIIRGHLITWRPVLESADKSDVLHYYIEKVLKRFQFDYVLSNEEILPFHKLTQMYVHLVASKLEALDVNYRVPGRCPVREKDEKHTDLLEKCIANIIKGIQFDVIPFTVDLHHVVNEVYRRFDSSFLCLRASDINFSSVREVFDDLEDEKYFITKENEMLKVRAKMSEIGLVNFKNERVEAGVLQKPYINTEESHKEKNIEPIYIHTRKKNKRNIRTDQSHIASGVKGKNIPLADANGRVQCYNKEVGSRVYAEFTNKEYYWGYVGQVFRDRKNKSTSYKILFEDGDVLDNVANHKVFTELRYKDIFKMDPPIPLSSVPNSISRTLRNKPTALQERMESRGRNDIGKNRSDRQNEDILSQKEPMTPKRLRKRRCKVCALCVKKDCERCFTCLRNQKIDSGSKEVCLQKMCCDIPVQRKSQPAPGFPEGWHFVFENTKKAFRGNVSNNNLKGLSLFAPSGRKYYSIESVCGHYKKAFTDVEALSQTFLAYVGGASYQEDPNNILIGKGYYHEWTDVQSRKSVIFGVIVKCTKEVKIDGEVFFTVKHSKESLSLLNSFPNFGSTIQEYENVSSELAWGGCIGFERKMKIRDVARSVIKSIDKSIGCKTWIAPDMRREEIVRSKDGLLLPKLTLTLRGYKLVFSTKQSGISNAGNGVFVKCTSLFNDVGGNMKPNPERFQMRPGELLDIGVYAPFRMQDKKHECVFKLKNYLHAMICEEWCFNATEDTYQYDITDEITGEVHDIAKKHIPMYVNECNMNQIPSVYAEHDPEGSVHYLFGIAYDGNWEKYDEGVKGLNLAVNGEEVEIFVNYGLEYERVRLRKGYSAIPREEREKMKNILENDDDDFVDEIDDFCEEELDMCIKYFLNTFTDEKKQERMLKEEVRDKALEVARRMEQKAKKLLEKHSKTGEMTEKWSFCSELVRYAETLTKNLKGTLTTGRVPVVPPGEAESNVVLSAERAMT